VPRPASSTPSPSSSSASQLDVTQTITFPGKVTEGDGGKVEGNKVTFTDLDSHTVRGGDGSTPVWVWILIAVGALVVIGGGAAAFFITRYTIFGRSLFAIGRAPKAAAPRVPATSRHPRMRIFVTFGCSFSMST